MRKIDPPPELTGWDFIIAGLVSGGACLLHLAEKSEALTPKGKPICCNGSLPR